MKKKDLIKKVLVVVMVCLGISGCTKIIPRANQLTYYIPDSWGEGECYRTNQTPFIEWCYYIFGNPPSVVSIRAFRYGTKARAQEEFEQHIEEEEILLTNDDVYENSASSEWIDVCNTQALLLRSKIMQRGDSEHDTYMTHVAFVDGRTLYLVHIELDSTIAGLEFEQSEVDKMISSIECQ